MPGQLLISSLVLLFGFNSPAPIVAQANNEPALPRVYTAAEKKQAVHMIVATALTVIPEPPDCAAEPCVALTFDDGPDPATTPQILDTLQTENVNATFFVLGTKVAGNEAILQREHAEGHEIGNHTWDHKDLTRLNNMQITAEIEQANKAIVGAGVPSPQLFRPPYGAINSHVASTSPMPIILWNVDPKDWHHKDPNEDVRAVVDAVQPGSIVLLHDMHATTRTALPQIITELKQRGYKFVTVSQLLQLPAGTKGIYRSR